MSIFKKFLPGILVLSIGIVAAGLIVKFGPEPDSQKAEIFLLRQAPHQPQLFPIFLLV